MLDVENGREVGTQILRDGLDAGERALPEARGGVVERFLNFRPPSCDRAERIRQSDIVSMRAERLERLPVSLSEFIQGGVGLLDDLSQVHGGSPLVRFGLAFTHCDGGGLQTTSLLCYVNASRPRIHSRPCRKRMKY